MRPLNFQFFLLFGSFAAVQPYLALLFKERGLNEGQIGYAMGMSGWAIMLSPALITFVADTKVSPRRLVSFLCVASAGALVALAAADSYWLLMAFYFLYSLVVTAMVPLQDGVVFGYQKMQEEEGKPPVSYAKVRVWGTYGYISILALLFFPLKWYAQVELPIYFAIGCFGFLLLNSFALPDRGRRETAKRAQGLPTGDALNALFRGGAVWFSLGMFLLLACSAAYHTMYPIFLTDELGLEKHWVGIVIISGALVEIFFILGLARFERKWGLRNVMLVCVFLTVIRFGLMYAVPNLIVAIGTQIFHGPMICAMMVIPPTFANSLATESNRNSIQGVYTMLIVGTSRFAGTAMSGHVAALDQRFVHLACAGMALGSFALLWKGFRPKAAV